MVSKDSNNPFTSKCTIKFTSLYFLILQVSIVSNILSLASCASDPVLPFFSRDTIARAIVTVVDGFLEMCSALPIFISVLFWLQSCFLSKLFVLESCRNDSSRSFGVIDKINIFRPDRVFMVVLFNIIRNHFFPFFFGGGGE